MNRIDKHFTVLKQQNKTALILFITAGDPDIGTTLDIMTALADSGTDCIELGVPFSDPMADGPIIQKSAQRALRNNINPDMIFDLVKQFRMHHDTPIVLMGYLNPILRYNMEKFIPAYKAIGGDGLVVADLPYEEGEEMEQMCNHNELDLIYLLAPEIGTTRTQRIVDATRGFVYCVSHYGTTGVNDGENRDLGQVITSLKTMTDLPVAVGFGISSLEKAKAMSKIADGIIIGSWLVKELEVAPDKARTAGEFAKNVKEII